MKPNISHLLNQPMKYLMLLAALCAFVSTFAQSKLTLQANDSLAFRCSIDGNEVNSLPLSELTIPGLAPGKREILLSFANGTQHKQILTLKDKLDHHFELREVKGTWRFTLNSEVSFSPVPLNGLNSGEVSDSLVIVKVESYTGSVGCENPATESEFEALKRHIEATTFEMKKVEKMKNFLMLSCVRVDQLRYMLAILEIEDSKLKVLQAAQGHIFDTDHIQSVLDDFFLEKNKEKARSIIQ